MTDEPMPNDEEGWRKRLTPEQYRVLREKGTEAPVHGRVRARRSRRHVQLRGCGNPLFSSDAKFDSGTGWPSFDEALPGAVESRPTPRRHGAHRDHLRALRRASRPRVRRWPGESGKRYCINSVCLNLDDKD